MAKKARTKKAAKKVAKKKPSKSSKTSLAGVDLQDVWPQERDFMERPDRYRYVRKIIRPDGCVFCQARDQGVKLESLVLYREKHALVVLNKFPYNNGHTLVIPTRHCGDLTELSQEEYVALSHLLRRTIDALQKSYGCPGMNIGLNHGAVAGAGIPDHLHWHVIPRWRGDTNFFPLIAETKVLAETVEQTYNRLRPFFEE